MPFEGVYRSRGGFAALLVLAAATTVGGCAKARVGQPLTGSLGGNDPASRGEFWYQLARRPVASNDEAFHALLLYLNDEDPAGDYAGRVAELKSRGLLATGFDGGGEQAVERGTLAVALCKALHIQGGLTMRLTGVTPRYAVRALEYRGLYPTSSPQQTLSGTELVGVLGRVEDYQRGNPADAPAALLPGEIGGSARRANGASARAQLKSPRGIDLTRPVLLVINSTTEWWAVQPADQGANPGAAPASPATAPAAPTKDKPVALKAIVTGVEGDLAEVRRTPADKWERAKVGMTVGEAAEFRTGDKSAVRFVIPPKSVYTVDRQSSMTVMQAYYDGQKVKTAVAMEQGRVRLDVAQVQRVPQPAAGEEAVPLIEEGGVEHDATISSPNTALAVRGTMVSLYDQPPFTPEAVSLTGRAVFRNTKRQLVPFGGTSRTTVRGEQSSAAEQALVTSTIDPTSSTAQNDFQSQETALLVTRGGFVQGDVLVGSTPDIPRVLPGVLNFVLRWDGGPSRQLNDLNLAVISPLSRPGNLDFVANPPFTVSLTPGDPAAEALRAEKYPRSSPSGGRIGRNHVGPEGEEIAYWPASYPAGGYRVAVYNLVDAEQPPTEVIKPVNYRVDVILAGRPLGGPITGTVGQLQTSTPVQVDVPAQGAGASAAAARGARARGHVRPQSR